MHAPGALQEAQGVWADFDHELRDRARQYLWSFELGSLGHNATAPRNEPSDWYATSLILGTKLVDRIKGGAQGIS